MPSEDMVRLRHMLDAAREAMRLAEDKSEEDLATGSVLSLALVRLVEIVGEAASHVSQDGRARLPEVPWADIVGMRNRLVHAYFDVNMAIVRLTVIKFLPDLACSIEKILEKDRHQ
jgi:uncharacterized protein with HEPN domain